MNHLQLTRSSRLALSISLGLLLTLTAIVTIQADGPGDLDTTFNGTGVVTTPVGSGHDWAFGIAVQPDGKLVAVGETFDGGHLNFAVVRYIVTGGLDTTFNHTGIVTTSIGGNLDTAQSVALQPDGKIVVAGYSRNNLGYDDFAVARYTISGVLDSTFNNGGVVTTSIGSADDQGGTVALQPNGKIVVAGLSKNSGGVDNFALVRYTPTGTLDSTFNGTGLVTTSIGSADDRGYGVALQPDGKIVMVGSSRSSQSNHDFAVVRYTSDGTLDPLFNNGTGIITTPLSSAADVAYRVVIQPDGKLVTIGYGDGGKYFAVVRYTLTGTLDTKFNHTGIATATVDSSQEGDGVALQSDGRIVAVGSSCNSNISHCDVAVLRFRSDGTLDPAFNDTGVVTTSIGNMAGGISVVLQPDEKIVVVGQSDGDFAVVRYLSREYLYLPVVLKD